jgi:S-adenosylmethionine:tRNA ribosyltransferase-isomerase
VLLSDIDYDLPGEAIAQRPLEDRASSKLLHLDRRTGEIHDRVFRDVVELLSPGDLLVVNNTRVSAKRVFGRKPTGAKVEMLLLRHEGSGVFQALVRPGKRLRQGAVVELDGGAIATIEADAQDGLKLVRIEGTADAPDMIDALGTVPLPPYIHSPIPDPSRYQTVYASVDGSAAAPTAGLHFTGEILTALRTKGVSIAEVTLDVGIDTFRLIHEADPEKHQMHGERCTLSPETADAVANCQGRIIGVGTTSVRTLESFACGIRRVEPGSRFSSLFIRPGYEFRVVGGMFTNFHMPRTTMLLMVSAMASVEALKRSYEHALANGYRFLSFGDSMLII